MANIFGDEIRSIAINDPDDWVKTPRFLLLAKQWRHFNHGLDSTLLDLGLEYQRIFCFALT
jgi:hypothetical protein